MDTMEISNLVIKVLKIYVFIVEKHNELEVKHFKHTAMVLTLK